MAICADVCLSKRDESPLTDSDSDNFSYIYLSPSARITSSAPYYILQLVPLLKKRIPEEQCASTDFRVLTICNVLLKLYLKLSHE